MVSLNHTERTVNRRDIDLDWIFRETIFSEDSSDGPVSSPQSTISLASQSLPPVPETSPVLLMLATNDTSPRPSRRRKRPKPHSSIHIEERVREFLSSGAWNDVETHENTSHAVDLRANAAAKFLGLTFGKDSMLHKPVEESSKIRSCSHMGLDSDLTYGTSNPCASTLNDLSWNCLEEMQGDVSTTTQAEHDKHTTAVSPCCLLSLSKGLKRTASMVFA